MLNKLLRPPLRGIIFFEKHLVVVVLLYCLIKRCWVDFVSSRRFTQSFSHVEVLRMAKFWWNMEKLRQIKVFCLHVSSGAYQHNMSQTVSLLRWLLIQIQLSCQRLSLNNNLTSSHSAVKQLIEPYRKQPINQTKLAVRQRSANMFAYYSLSSPSKHN